MVPEKGLMTPLESLKLIQCSKEPNLLIVGSGPLLEQLNHICIENSISATFPGWVAFDRVNHYLSPPPLGKLSTRFDPSTRGANRRP
jgi:hypothetical protein